MSSRLRAVLGVTATLPLLLVAAPQAHAATSVLARIDFVEQVPGATITAPTVRGDGAAGLAARVVTEGGGRARTVDNPTSTTHRAMGLPAYAPLARPATPLAVLGIRNTTSVDRLAVGDRSFRWQADFTQNASLGTVAADGDNVFQRGLATQASQWKLSADGHRVGCSLRIRGVGIETGTTTIGDTGWYRASCARVRTGTTTATLTLTLQRWDGTRYVTVRTRTATGNAAGRLDFALGVPASAGGKLRDDGSLHAEPDQFNGVVDNPELSVW